MRELYGNLIDLAEAGEFDVICHGANCLGGVMGAGLALELKKRYPVVYQVDVAAAYASKNKLGNISVAGCGGFVVVNCYSQQNIGNGVQASYTAIRDSLKKVAEAFPGKRLGIPLIGCGYGGLDEVEVLKIFEEVVPGATLVRFQPKRDIPRFR